jgi:serine/threonine protein kinase
MMIMRFADKGNLRSILSNNFDNILWKDKIFLLWKSAADLSYLHGLGYFHKDFHSGNILQWENISSSLAMGSLASLSP